jgi:cobalamin biosynthesis protein CobT
MFQSCLQSLFGNDDDVATTDVNNATVATTITATSSYAMLRCISDAFEQELIKSSSSRNNDINSNNNGTQQQQQYDDNNHNDAASVTASSLREMYLFYDAVLIFFMQAGFAMICAGSVRRKN